MIDVPQGYKQTEVGVIPEDWEAKSLSGLAPIATGNTPPTRDTSNYGDEFLFVSPVDMGYAKHISHTEKMLSKKGFAISRRFPKNSILFVCIGSTIGKCGIASKDLTSNQQINAIFPTTSFSTDYIYYAVAAAAPKIKALAGEQAVPIVNKTQFSEAVIPLPPTKAEQEAIAEALSDADALIESLEQLLAKKRHLKQGAMQQLLTGKKRLPGFEVKPGYKQTEVGVIPEDWVVSKIGAEFSIQLGKMLDVEKNVGAPKSFLGNRAVQWGRVDLTDIGEIKLTPSDLQRFRLRDGDLLVCEGGEIGRAAIWRQPVDECYYQKALHRLRPIRGYNVQLMFNMLQRLASTGFLSNYVTQTSIAHLPKDKFEIVPIPVPPAQEEQTAIATILSDMDAELAALEAKLAKASNLKQGMMQELLTGRIRLV